MEDSAELNDILAEVGHQGKELYITMSFHWEMLWQSAYQFSGDIHVYLILEGQTKLTKRHLKSINAFIQMLSQCLILPQSLSLSFSCTSLSALPHCVFISVSALLLLSVHFVCSVGALYLFYHRQIPGVCIFSQHANCCLKCGKLLVFVFIIFMINFLAAAGSVRLHCC